MSTKSRGTNAERDLVHKFWEAGWACFRAAGSGSNHYPTPDIIAGNNNRKIAVEAKLTTEEKKYFSRDEIDCLKIFSEKFGAEPWVAIKFFREEWIFLTIDDLEETNKHFVASKEIAKRRGLTFTEFINF